MAHRVASWKLGTRNNSPLTFHDTVLQPGMKLGQFYEDYAGDGVQLFQLKDTTAVAGDALYYKSYSALTVTPTIGNSSSGELAGFAPATLAVDEYVAVRKKGVFSVKANGVFARGTPICADSGNNRVVPAGWFAKIAAAVLDTGGGALSWVNPYTDDIFVTRLVVDVTTAATDGTATLNVGTTAVNGTTSSNNLLTALDVHTATGAFDNYVNPGASGKAMLRLASGTWVTGSKGAGSLATWAANFYIHFMRTAGTHPPQIGIAQGAVAGGKVSALLDLSYLG